MTYRNSIGATLLELLIVIMVFGGLASISAFAVGGGRSPERKLAILDSASRMAILTGRRIVLAHPDTASLRVIAFLPDGRLVEVGVDPVRGKAW